MIIHTSEVQETATRRKRGAPKKDYGSDLAAVEFCYFDFLTWLKERKRRYGHLKGWLMIRDADWWQGPPSERALRMARKRVKRFHCVTPAHLRNLLSAMNTAYANSHE